MTEEPPEAPLHPSDRRINGWLVLYGPEFRRSYDELRADVRKHKVQLSPDEYRQHATVKLFAHVGRFVREIVPSNPNAPEFNLSGDLSHFRRGKGHGLPERYRIFWTFTSRHKVIIFLSINDDTTLRKEGSTRDPYEVFRRLLRQGRIGADFQANYQQWREANPGFRDSIAGAVSETEVGPRSDA
jgi:toxin YhaV